MTLKKLVLPLLVFVAATALFPSCTKEEDITQKYVNDPGRGFFPLEVGHFVEYIVDSTIYNDYDGSTRAARYRKRYLVADTFLDNEGRKSFRIEISTRKNSTDPWVATAVDLATATAGRLEYVESNVRFIKLVYPIANGTTWDGNAMIATDDPDLQHFAGWNYKYQNAYQDFVYMDTVGFSNSVTVNEVNDTLNNPGLFPTAYAYKTYAKEVYSIGIGLVYREYTRWTYDPNVGVGRNGFTIKMLAVDHN